MMVAMCSMYHCGHQLILEDGLPAWWLTQGAFAAVYARLRIAEPTWCAGGIPGAMTNQE